MKRLWAIFLVLCLAAPVSAAELTLSWNVIAEATGYTVLYGVSPDSLTETVDAGLVTTFTVPGLELGTVYFFKVRGYTATAEGKLSPGAFGAAQLGITTLSVE